MALAPGDNATLFSAGAASTLRLIVYLAAAVILMIVDHRGGYLQTLRGHASLLVEPAYRLAALPADAARATRTAVASQSALVAENRELREALLLAQARLNRADAVAAQNERLQDLLEAQKSLGLSVQMASLLDIDIDPGRRRLVINRGTRQGVSVGQPVIDALGIMGQVVEVLPNTAVVMLLTDPGHAIPVTIERTGMRTIAYGDKDARDLLELSNIPTSADVQVGDKLITSGLGGRFPSGFPVGEIRDVRNDDTGMFATALATPAAAINRSSEVLLLHDLPQPYGPPQPQVDATAPATVAPAPAPEPVP